MPNLLFRLSRRSKFVASCQRGAYRPPRVSFRGLPDSPRPPTLQRTHLFVRLCYPLAYLPPSVGPSQRCSGLLVDPRLIISSRHLASYRDLAPVDVSDTGSDTQENQGHPSSQQPPLPPRRTQSTPPTPPGPAMPLPTREWTGPGPASSGTRPSGDSPAGGSRATPPTSCQVDPHLPRRLPDFQQDPALAGVAAAAAHLTQPTADDAQAFEAIMEEIATLPVGTVAHVPRAVRTQLATVLTDCLQAARNEGLWGFVRLMLLAKSVLRSPPRGGRKKRYVVSACIGARIRRWQQGELVALWREAREKGWPRTATCSTEA